jgi:squalene cyclase
LQDDAWQTWNEAMKTHLLARQESNGSWPTDDEWGGYGGRIYTTSMAALCLEVYYRHAIRQQRTANSEAQMPTMNRGMQ